MPKNLANEWPNDDDMVAHFDMDGSLADYVSALVRDLEPLRASGEDPITAESIWTMDHLPHISHRMNLIKHQPDWWFNLEPIEAGMTVLRMCAELGFEIAILTKGPEKHTAAWTEKLRWCQKHVGKTGVTVTLNKSRVYGKILYDDYPDYMTNWLKYRPRGLGIMPVNAGNANFSYPNVVMYRDLSDLGRIRKAILAAKNRKPGEPLVLE